MRDTVAVIDFGSQYSHLIVRRLRERGAYAELLAPNVPLSLLATYKAIILSGGPQNLSEPDALRVDKKIFDFGIPILGICYGMQLMAFELGGAVAKGKRREYGRATVSIVNRTGLLQGLEETEEVWMSHGDQVTKLPEGFTCVASTDTCPIVAMENVGKNLYAIQFHPEVSHTPSGMKVLGRFLEIAKVSTSWSLNEEWVDGAVQKIKEQVGARRVLCALSGGVDSSVAAYLVYKAIGTQLTCLYVDTGFMRQGETEEIKNVFSLLPDLDFKFVDKEELFLQKIEGISDPETKRKNIGETFIRVFEQESKSVGDIAFLVQGTLYTDVITSGVSVGGKAAVIKSHHNVGGLPKDLGFELIEPLRDLYKDEVRALGKVLGVPESIVTRQPFPGPGLAIRIIGAVTKEKLEILREADAIFREEMLKFGGVSLAQQYFAALPDIRSVGVQGDQRSYGYPIILRAVTTSDFMTADWARLPYDLLAKVSERITNEVRGVNRVVYDITSKPPGTIEWE